MNILPFVIGLLLMLAITSNVLLKKKITDDMISKSLTGNLAASRKALNISEKDYYKSIPKAKSSKKPKKNNDSKKDNKKNHNTRKIEIQNAKINIYPLVMEKKENNIELYKLTASLIKELYSNKNFYTPNFEKEILNSILNAFEIQLKKDKDINFANLFLKNNSLQKTYYLILKGTKFYDHDKNIGVPSLLDFIKFENSNSKIPMKDTSYELLVTIFNRSVAEEIKNLQTQVPLNLSKESIINICQKHSFRLDEKMLEFFDFSNSLIESKDKVIVGLDKSTNIKVKRKPDL